MPTPDYSAVHSERDALARHATVFPQGALVRRLEDLREENPEGQLVVKLGFDPTAPDLHLGHAVVLNRLAQFQKLGHKVVVIIGDFTAQIGDPTGRDQTRPPLTAADVDRNAQTYLDQLEKILDTSDPATFEVRRNGEWFSVMSLREGLRMMAMRTLGQSLERDSFSDRLREDHPLHVHELVYPLLQATDSIQIDSDVELGGSDQLVNCKGGRDLQAAQGRKHPQVVLLMPLIRGLDGKKKMGKSLGNYVGLKDEAELKYAKLMSLPDDPAVLTDYVNLALNVSELIRGIVLGQIQEASRGDKNYAFAREAIAYQVVRQYDGEEAAIRSKAAYDSGKLRFEFVPPVQKAASRTEADPQLMHLLTEDFSGLKPDAEGVVRVLPEGGLEEKLALAQSEARPLRVKLNLDTRLQPLHLGYGPLLKKARELQQAGHTIVLCLDDLRAKEEALTGEARSAFLDQLKPYLDLSQVEVHSLSEALEADMLIDGIRMMAQHTVTQVLDHERLKPRVNSISNPIGLEEMAYPILRGELSVRLNTDVELAPVADAVDAVVGQYRQKRAGKPEQAAVLMATLPGTDGKKTMGEVPERTVFFNDEPRVMFRKCMEVPDEAVASFWSFALGVDTEDRPEFDRVCGALARKEDPIGVKKAFARFVVARFHGAAAAVEAERIFSSQLSGASEVVEYHEVQFSTLSYEGRALPLADLSLVQLVAALEPGKRKPVLIRDMIGQGSVRVEGQVVGDVRTRLTVQDGMTVQIGKRGFYRIKL